jgi:hypothetical protein
MTDLQTSGSTPDSAAQAGLVYPFAASVLDPADVAFVERELAQAELAAPLLTAHPGLTRVAVVFLRHCSPPSPSREALAIVARFLRIVLFFNDRVDPARTAEDALVVWRHIIDPRRPPPGLDGAPPTAIELAAADVGQRLAQALATRGVDATSFAHLFRMNLAAFVHATDSGTPEPATQADHLELRSETISAMAYLRLWGLLGGLEIASEMQVGFLLQQAERLSARVQALANDLRSVERDASAGQANVVLIEQRLRGVSREVAVASTRARHAESLRALVAVLATARSQATHAPGLARYLRFIEICTCGNNHAMDELSARYA